MSKLKNWAKGMPGDKTITQMRKLFKNLGINTANLRSNSQLYTDGGKYTWSYKDSSMWYCTYHPRDGSVEINTKYFDVPTLVKEYNNKIYENR